MLNEQKVTQCQVKIKAKYNLRLTVKLRTHAQVKVRLRTHVRFRVSLRRHCSVQNKATDTL